MRVGDEGAQRGKPFELNWDLFEHSAAYHFACGDCTTAFQSSMFDRQLATGGLGKVPGFYYVQQNRENLDRLRRELRTAVSRAMQASPQTLEEMSCRAMDSTFPLVEWQVGPLPGVAQGEAKSPDLGAQTWKASRGLVLVGNA